MLLLESPFAAANRRLCESFSDLRAAAAAFVSATASAQPHAGAAHAEADRLMALFPPMRYAVHRGTLRQSHWCGGTEAEKIVRESPPAGRYEELPAWRCATCGDLLG